MALFLRKTSSPYKLYAHSLRVSLLKHPAFADLEYSQWFDRHPREMVVSSYFVDEMTANVLSVLQLHPDAIRDTLVAIGQLYLDRLGRGSFISALSRRQRTLARLRTMEDPLQNLELALCMLVQLAGLEVRVFNHCSIVPPSWFSLVFPSFSRSDRVRLWT